MPIIEIDKLPLVKGEDGIGYPPPFDKNCDLFESADIGSKAGLTQFGVGIEKLLPGGMSSQRHWHENEDEFLYMLSGELVLVENDGEHIVTEGTAIAWKAGDSNAHHLINRTDEPAFFLIIGTRAKKDICHYPDIDLLYSRNDSDSKYTRKDGTAIETPSTEDPK